MKKEIIILLAEDDKGHANLLMRNLKRAGVEYQILHFENGEEILDYLLDNENYSNDSNSYILLLDISMPKVDGIEVLRQVKQNNTLSKFPVIMVTTTDEPETVRQCYEMGCIQYVVKPVGHEKFIETINHLGQFLMTVDVPA